MTKHFSNIFQYDKHATQVAYKSLANKFENDQIKLLCLSKITDAAKRNLLDIGVDFKKPWEEIEQDNFYQMEYLFVGKLESKNETNIIDDQIGINVFEENRFGKIEFGTEDILNLTLIINK